MVDGQVAMQLWCWAAGSQRQHGKEKKLTSDSRQYAEAGSGGGSSGGQQVVVWLSTWAAPMMVDVAVNEDMVCM